MANEQRPKGECPFCGSETYECVAKWMGDGQYRRAAAYYRCRKCYARGPVISSEREYDVRNERPDSMLLQLRASAAWRMRLCGMGDRADAEKAQRLAEEERHE